MTCSTRRESGSCLREPTRGEHAKTYQHKHDLQASGGVPRAISRAKARRWCWGANARRLYARDGIQVSVIERGIDERRKAP